MAVTGAPRVGEPELVVVAYRELSLPSKWRAFRRAGGGIRRRKTVVAAGGWLEIWGCDSINHASYDLVDAGSGR